MPTDVQPGDLVLVAAGGRVCYARVLVHETRVRQFRAWLATRLLAVCRRFMHCEARRRVPRIGVSAVRAVAPRYGVGSSAGKVGGGSRPSACRIRCWAVVVSLVL